MEGFLFANNFSNICTMYIVAIKFIGAFPEGDRLVEISSPNGAGASTYHIMVDKHYWGVIGYYLDGWRVALQKKNPDYSAGDLQPLIDMILGN
jgi:hypothetical protein